MNRPIVWPLVLLACAGLLASPPASADLIRQVQERACPSGSVLDHHHGGSSCTYALPLCSSDSDCEAGHRCLSVSRCEETGTGVNSGGSFTFIDLHFPDARSRDCRVGTCTTSSRCTASEEAAQDACGTGPVRPEELDSPSAPESGATSQARPETPSRCAPITAGLSATMAGMLGLAAIGRRRA